MRIGLCKEIKNNEGRVALTPIEVIGLTDQKIDVLVEKDAGNLSGFTNQDYISAGATIISNKEELFHSSNILVKVKELLEDEYDLLNDGQVIFGFFHLTSNKKLTDLFLKRNITSIDYEYFRDPKTMKRTITMSPVAGRLGVLLGFQSLYSIYGGKGLLPMGVPGVEPIQVAVLGAGDAGLGAIHTCLGLSCRTTIMETNVRKLQELENLFANQASYMISNRANIIELLKRSDVIINCVYWDKLRKDHLIYRDDLKLMKKGSLIIDISCDVNGAVETCRATHHDDPCYRVDDIIHYCVDNIPGAVPQTSSKYLAAQSFPYILKTALDHRSYISDSSIKTAILTHAGKLRNKLVAEKWNMQAEPLE